MTTALSTRCAQHEDRFECPDALVDYSTKFDEYGIIIHDGGGSILSIAFCPWCGSALPKSKRDRWFDELSRLGITDPYTRQIPPEYSSDLWWRTSASLDASPPSFFLNVDLDIELDGDPAPLIEALEPWACSLERPPGRASFELGAHVSPQEPEPLILDFVRLINALSGPARAVWDGATRRTFDIGMQSKRQPGSANHRLTPETLRAAADIGAEIAVTMYGQPEDDAG